MLDIELFRQIKEYQKLGLSKNKISKITGVYYNKVTEVFLQTEEVFIASITDNTPDRYRGYILNIIKFYPQTKNSVIWYRLGEEFPNHELKRATFYRYMKRIREESGFVNPNKRVYTSREVPKPGEEAQVDFGQFKLLNMYGHNVRVYFFCMIMSYSKMKFVYFVSEPFTTKTAIEAHDHAFKYFGGVPKTIIYDQDRVFVSRENFGEIIFVNEFEEYVRKQQYSVVLCRKHDPESKGRVEGFVSYVKTHFLTGKEYCGIGCLNSDAIMWIDNIANAKGSHSRGKSPLELFHQERKYLLKAYVISKTDIVVSVDKYGTVKYGANKYLLPKGIINPFSKVRIEKEEDELYFYDCETGDLLYKHMECNNENQVIPLQDAEVNRSNFENANIIFKEYDNAIEFLALLEKKEPRYGNSQARRITKLTRFYTIEQVANALAYCLEKNRIHVLDVQGYLHYMHGEKLARKYLKESEYINTRDKGLEIQEEENGKNK